jgi:hypothetical protein
MTDTFPDPSQQLQTVQPTAAFNPQTASAADTGGQTAAAVGNLGGAATGLADQMDRFHAIYQADQDRLTNFNLEKSYTEFTAGQQNAMTEAAANVPAGGQDFTKTQTKSFDDASSKWLEQVPANLQPKWQAQMAKTRAAFSTGALALELKERDSYYKNTVTTQLNRFGNGIGQTPAAYDNYRKMGNDFIDASGMSPGDKNVAKKGWASDSANVLAQTLLLKDPGGFKEAVQAGDPRFQDLDADHVRSLVSAADREQRTRALEAKQAANLANAGSVNTLLLNIHDGKAGQVDIDNARQKGILKDYSDVARADAVLKNQEENTGSMAFVNAAMSVPNFPFNPYDPQQVKGVNSAVRASGGSPQAALDIYNKTGILGEAGAVAIRGGLVSTDPQRVQSVANIAGNMIARNPNAFAGVEGRADIEKSALLFNHYTDDLGFDANTAAQKVAQANDPTYQSKIKISDQDVADFRKKLIAQTPVAALAKSKNTFFGMFGGNVSASQVPGAMKASIATDYGELASDFYQKTGDAAAAQSYAQQKINGLYGVSNGQLMKYPPEKIYPAMGDKPSTGYIYQQAVDDVKAATGKTVVPKDIVLTPLPTATAEAWRNNSPAPYQLHYYEDVGGQRVLQTVPRTAFVADPHAEAKRLTKDRSAEFDALRHQHKDDAAMSAAFAGMSGGL